MAKNMRAVGKDAITADVQFFQNDIKGGAGPASALFINAETPRPTPTASQALVRVKCFGLNRADTLQRQGKYPVPPQAPKTLGLEFSGTIEALGDAQGGSEHWAIGDEVFGLVYGGAYAEYVAVSTHMLCRKPKELSWEQCAAVSEVWITALQAIHLIGHFNPGAGPKEDKSILWHAGASSVSIAGIQLSQTLSNPPPKVFATARSDEKCDFIVKQLGATAAVNTKSHAPEGKGWAKEILNLTDGRGVDVIIDFIGASYFEGNLEAAARDGRIVSLGNMGGTILGSGVNIGAFLMKRVRYQGSTLRSRDEEYQGKLRDLMDKEVVPKLRDGSFKAVIDKVMSWKDIAKAHEMLETNQTKGKIVCTVD